jgi:hypothetical protein
MADSDALKFRVDLVGNMVQELVASGKAATTAEGGIQALTGAILQMTEARNEPKEHGFFTFDLAQGAEMAIHLVETLAEKVFDLGKEIVNTVAQTQDLNLALKLTVGDDNVNGVKELIDSFGDTRFDDDRIKKAVLPLLEVGGGKDKGLLKDIITAGMDIAARTANQVNDLYSPMPRPPVAPVAPTAPSTPTPAPAPAPASSAPASTYNWRNYVR